MREVAQREPGEQQADHGGDRDMLDHAQLAEDRVKAVAKRIADQGEDQAPQQRGEGAEPRVAHHRDIGHAQRRGADHPHAEHEVEREG